MKGELSSPHEFVKGSDRDGHRDLIKLGVKSALHIESLVDIEVCDLTAAHYNNTVADVVLEQLDRLITHLACNDSVSECRRTAALNVTENCSSRLDVESLLDVLCEISYAADALGNNDDKVFLAGFLSVDDSGDNIALDVVLDLGDEDRGSACGDTCLKGNVAAASAHYLNDRAAVM